MVQLSWLFFGFKISSYRTEEIELIQSFENRHCMKIIQIRSYFWSVFSFIQSQYREIRTRNNSALVHFLRSAYHTYFNAESCLWCVHIKCVPKRMSFITRKLYCQKTPKSNISTTAYKESILYFQLTIAWKEKIDHD